MDHSKTIRDIIVVFLISVLTGLFAYILRIYVAKTYTVEDYGLLYSMYAFFSFILIFVDLGLFQSMIKEIAKYRVNNDVQSIKNMLFTTFIIQTLFATLISLILIIFSKSLNLYFFHNTNTIFFYIFIFWILTFPFAYFVIGYLLGHEKTTWFGLSELVKILFVLIVSTSLYYLNASIISVFIGYALTNVLLIILFVLLNPKFFSPFNFHFNFRLIYPKLLKYGIYIVIGGFASVILVQTDTLMITYFLGLNPAGVYQSAVPLASIILVLITPITTVLLSKISNLWAQDKKTEIESLLSLVQKYILILVLPITLTLILFSELILKILFTVQYISASHPLMILSFAFMISAISVILTYTLIAIGDAKKVMHIVIFGAIINLIGNYLLIHIFNITGAAISTLISNVVMFFILRYALSKNLHIDIDYFTLLKTFFAVALFVVSMLICREVLHINYLLAAIVGTFISGIVYLLALFATKVITKDDILFIKKMFRLNVKIKG